MTRIKRIDGFPRFSPDHRGVWVEDLGGVAGWRDVTALPEDMPAEERAEVATALAAITDPDLGTGLFTEAPQDVSERPVSPAQEKVGQPPYSTPKTPARQVSPVVQAPPPAPSVPARELAAALAGREALDHEAQAAKARRETALALKAEAEARMALAKAQQAEAAAEVAARANRVPATIVTGDMASAQEASRIAALAASTAEARERERDATIRLQARLQQTVAGINEARRQEEARTLAARRRRVGTSNGQLFWWGVLGWIGGIVLGKLIGQGIGLTPEGIYLLASCAKLIGAYALVAARVARGKRREAEEDSEQRRQVFLSRQEA